MEYEVSGKTNACSFFFLLPPSQLLFLRVPAMSLPSPTSPAVNALLCRKGSRSWDMLPGEIVAHILTHCHIRQVFISMSVSRKWEAACRYVIRTRECLIMNDCRWSHDHTAAVRMTGWERNHPHDPRDRITMSIDSLIPAMLISLIQMQNLKRLCVCWMREDYISPLIRKNKNSLTILDIDFGIRDISRSHAFPCLAQLRCHHFDPVSASRFPNLTDLVIDAPVWQLKRFPTFRLPGLKRLLIGKLFRDSGVEEKRISKFIQVHDADLQVMRILQ